MSKRALLIGINYRGTAAELAGCIADVYAVERQLRTAYGYSRVEIMTDDTAVKPTRANIEAALTRFVTGVAPGDTLFLHYSGHGTRVQDLNKEEESGQDSAIVPLDYAKAGVILDDALRRLVAARLPARARLFALLDCCHSGTAFDLRYQYMDMSTPAAGVVVAPATPYVPDRWVLRQMTREFKAYPRTAADVVMLSGCRDEQTSADSFEDSSPCGALTWAFLRTLRDAPRPKWKHLLKDVNGRLQLKGYSQKPQLSCGLALVGDDLAWW